MAVDQDLKASLQEISKFNLGANLTPIVTDKPQLNDEDTGNKQLIKAFKKQLIGFYSFAFATEPYYITAMGVAIPIILESLSASAGFKSDDLSVACDTSVLEYRCKVNLFGLLWIDTESFSLYTTAISVALQAVVFTSCSSLADYGTYRKPMLLLSAACCGIFCISFLLVLSSNLYWFAAILTILSNVSFGACYVFYYSYVPLLAKTKVKLLNSIKNDNLDDDFKISTLEQANLKEQVVNELTSKGVASGCIGGVLNLLISLLLMILCNGLGPTPIYPLNIACSFAGAWVLCSIPLANHYLPPFPGPPLPNGTNYIMFSWRRVMKTLSRGKELSEIFKFLTSWFLMSDVMSTVVTVFVIFGKKVLDFNILEMLMTALILPIITGIGCLFWLKVQSHFKIPTMKMITFLSSLYLIIPVYALMGLIPSLPFGVKNKWEGYFFVSLHGFMIGAIQSFYRAQFSELIPENMESEFFGLYEITDKGSSWIGPLVIAIVTDLTGNIRFGYFFLLFSIIVTLFITTVFVNVNKGKRQAEEYNRDY